MNLDHYKNVGFQKVAHLTKDVTLGNKKYNVYVNYIDYDPKGKKGVYMMTKGNDILRIGETENLHSRFQRYESHSGSTNAFVRENMDEVTNYVIYFIECPHYTVGFAGVFVDSGISYKKLEKQLLLQFREKTGALPIWNKGIQ